MGSTSNLGHLNSKRLSISNMWKSRYLVSGSDFFYVKPLRKKLKYQFDPIRINWRRPRALWHLNNLSFPQLRFVSTRGVVKVESGVVSYITPPPNRAKRLYSYFRELKHFLKRKRPYWTFGQAVWSNRNKPLYSYDYLVTDRVLAAYGRFSNTRLFNFSRTYINAYRLWSRNMVKSTNISYLAVQKNIMNYSANNFLFRKSKFVSHLRQRSNFYRRYLTRTGFNSRISILKYWLKTGKPFIRTFFRRRSRFVYARPLRRLLWLMHKKVLNKLNYLMFAKHYREKLFLNNMVISSGYPETDLVKVFINNNKLIKFRLNFISKLKRIKMKRYVDRYNIRFLQKLLIKNLFYLEKARVLWRWKMRSPRQIYKLRWLRSLILLPNYDKRFQKKFVEVKSNEYQKSTKFVRKNSIYVNFNTSLLHYNQSNKTKFSSLLRKRKFRFYETGTFKNYDKKSNLVYLKSHVLSRERSVLKLLQLLNSQFNKTVNSTVDSLLLNTKIKTRPVGFYTKLLKSWDFVRFDVFRKLNSKILTSPMVYRPRFLKMAGRVFLTTSKKNIYKRFRLKNKKINKLDLLNNKNITDIFKKVKYNAPILITRQSTRLVFKRILHRRAYKFLY